MTLCINQIACVIKQIACVIKEINLIIKEPTLFIKEFASFIKVDFCVFLSIKKLEPIKISVEDA